MKYFAYGSNMSLLRLRQRAPSAARIGVFILEKHELRFHKLSDDGSGKCDAYHTNHSSHVVMGALFDIDRGDKPALDAAEGLGNGYEQKWVQVKNHAGERHDAFTYYATHIDPALKPYSWYLNHVLVGAQETQVSALYLQAIESTASLEDPNLRRDAEQRALYS